MSIHMHVWERRREGAQEGKEEGEKERDGGSVLPCLLPWDWQEDYGRTSGSHVLVVLSCLLFCVSPDLWLVATIPLLYLWSWAETVSGFPRYLPSLIWQVHPLVSHFRGVITKQTTFYPFSDLLECGVLEHFAPFDLLLILPSMSQTHDSPPKHVTNWGTSHRYSLVLWGWLQWSLLLWMFCPDLMDSTGCSWLWQWCETS